MLTTHLSSAQVDHITEANLDGVWIVAVIEPVEAACAVVEELQRLGDAPIWLLVVGELQGVAAERRAWVGNLPRVNAHSISTLADHDTVDDIVKHRHPLALHQHAFACDAIREMIAESRLHLRVMPRREQGDTVGSPEP